MNTREFVHEAMPAAQGQRADVVAGSAFEVLIGLSALTRRGELARCSPDLRAALERVGARSAELWLHLLGVALAEPNDIVGAVRALDAAELRRHLVGVYVPAWRFLVGGDALEAAALGDASLLGHERYYAGESRESLERILPLTPARTKECVLDVLERYEDELFDPGVLAGLERDAAAKRQLGLAADDLIDLATGGYRYEPEPELGNVALVPHVAARPWLLLCQHERTRIICYPLPEPKELEERALSLGRALADEGRVRMLRRLAAGDATLIELAESAGLARSTAHHHLGYLRAAGLVTMHGNARAYWFTLRPDGLAEARRLLGELGVP